MAGYSIVLNLSGNSVTQSERLADNLWRAQASATRLATALGAVSTAARSIPANPMRSYGHAPQTGRSAGGNAPVTQMNAAATKMNVAATKMNVAASKQNTAATRNHTRAGANNPYWSTNSRMFGGNLGRVFTFGENDKLLGMDATSLMKGLNVASIATSIVTSVGKAVIKTMALATVAPVAIAGGGMMLAIRALQSESFAEGVRLISRRRMAKAGLGAQYEIGESNADFLTKSYGFDRSTTLSSINVLTGMGVGGSDRKLDIQEATSLTKIGGLISQQAGVSFERVMTNIQQLLVQATPNIRDIRELLNQAPVLGTYAMKEMADRGTKGVDVRTFLKDQSNLLSVLKRYELDNASNAGMQARGQIALAMQDMWAKIAGNDEAWRYVGHQGTGLIGSLGGGLNSLLSAVTSSPEVQVMAKNLEIMLDNVAAKGGTFMDKLISLVDSLSKRWGLGGGDPAEAKGQVDINRLIREELKDPKVRATIRAQWEKNTPHIKGQSQSLRDDSFNSFVANDYANFLINRKATRTEVARHGIGRYEALSETGNWVERLLGEGVPYGGSSGFYRDESGNSKLDNRGWSYEGANSQIAEYAESEAQKWLAERPEMRVFAPETGRNMTDPSALFARYVYDWNRALIAPLTELFNKQRNATSDLNITGSGGADAGDTISGHNRDRRNLEIHFHAPIVEWTSSIQASNPRETVDEIAENIEQLTSAGLQKALLGASNKMSSRWY